jgi:hypothetical protein
MYPVKPDHPLTVETYHRLNDLMQQANQRRLAEEAMPSRQGLFTHFHPKQWLTSLFAHIKPTAITNRTKSAVPLD